MRREDFQFLAELLKRRCGLSLTPARSELILTRLKPVADHHGFASVCDVVNELRHGNEPLAQAVMEAMTIRDTSFFRDPAAFDALSQVILPRLLRSRSSRRCLSIWSAACATGQEAYSIAMVFAGLPHFAEWDIDILATDVSPDAIARAKEGFYTQAEVQRGLPPQLLSDCFRPEGRGWRLRSSIRNCVQFRVLNLLDPFEAPGRFDVIFCRNVLMYFDSATKVNILDRLPQVLADDGCLVLGAAETMLGLSSSFASESRLRGIMTKAGHAHLSGAGAIG